MIVNELVCLFEILCIFVENVVVVFGEFGLVVDVFV